MTGGLVHEGACGSVSQRMVPPTPLHETTSLSTLPIGALRGRLITVLATDDATARGVLDTAAHYEGAAA